MNIKKLLIITLVVSLSSCQSYYMRGGKNAAEEVVKSLNMSDSSKPVQMSTVPFLFDSEIIVAETAVSKIWNGLVDAGFVITDPVITSISPVISEDYTLFRSSWEMEVFFKKNIPELCYKVKIEGVNGEVLMLISRENRKEYSLIGIKVDSK